MPSWNIHTAQVETLLAGHNPADLGIQDENAFLFGNYVPDVYVGFMVPDVSYHVDYCLTHEAMVNLIPVPDADRFWDKNIARRRPSAPAGSSLALGAWAHLVADRIYNGRFRSFWLEHDMPEGDALRTRKQGDFDLFGRTLGISIHVEATAELMEAAERFVPYHIPPEDVMRTIAVVDKIVERSQPGTQSGVATGERYQLLDERWLRTTFDACDERLAVWLAAWMRLEAAGRRCRAADVRAEAGLPPATPDDLDWMCRPR